MTAETLQEAEPPPVAGPSLSEENELFGASYPLHSFPVLLQQCQKRTYSLFVNSVGLRPPPFLPAVEEKVKLKLHDEYFFPPLPAATLSSSSASVPPFAIDQGDDAGAQTEPQKKALENGVAACETKMTESTVLAVPSQPADADLAKRPRVLACPAVHTPEMTVSELLSELSSRTAASSVPDASAGVSGGAAGAAPGPSKALAPVSAETGASGSPGGASGESGALARKETVGGELANLRLKNLPAALRPTWHAPWKLHRVIAGHLGWVTCLAVDPTNEWFATGSNDRLIKIWDLASGTLKLSLTGHVSAIRDIKISSRHPYMFTCGEDNRVKCWDLEQNKVVRDYHGHLSGVYTLALHPQLDILCSGGRDAVVRVWDMRTKHEIYVLSGHQGTIMSLQMQALEPHIISGSQDKMVRLWDLTAGKCSAVLTNHKKSIRAMAFHPQEYSFVSCAADKIKVWRNPLGQFERNIEGHNSIINCCAIKEDGDSSILIAGTNNGQLHFWDWASGYKFDTIQSRVQPGSLESENGIFCCALDKSETRLLTGECDKTIKVWKPDEEATEESHPLQWKPQRSIKRY
ncbi:UNVERIFIED_CONTAM: WD domain, G-beta repeat-containing protein [Hammondia hammondi]|eukprot:XP_008889339.1 WD domain, G-beta repeat-containing protein [Hammondia hammondi]